MTIRFDVRVNWVVSPRIIIVPEPSVEITVQDLVDTCRYLEEQFSNMSYPHLINAAGKEPLGAGVEVGITATLQNAQLQFEGRKCRITDGVCTANDPKGQTLIAAGSPNGEFLTLGVERGFTVLNTNTTEMAAILTVDSEDQLTSQPIEGCAVGTWTIGDPYIIYDNPVVNISGGNLVAVDDNDDPLEVVFQAPNVNVVRTASSSATTANLEAIQGTVYSGVVVINVIEGVPGTEFPTGTHETPSNNLIDAITIANERGIETLEVHDMLIIASGESISKFVVRGIGVSKTQIVLSASSIIDQAEFQNLYLTGTSDGSSIIVRGCVVDDLINANGFFFQCALDNTFTPANPSVLNILQSFSAIVGGGHPHVDLAGCSDCKIAVRDYNGGIGFINSDSNPTVSVDLGSGNIHLDNTVTTGQYLLQGVGTILDESIPAAGSPTLTVVKNVVNPNSVATATWEKAVNGVVEGSFGEVQKSQAFAGAIHVDQNNGLPGTTYPLGTEKHPTDNIADAVTIGQAEGISVIHIEEDITVLATDNIDGFELVGKHPTRSEIIVLAGASTSFSKFTDCSLTGTLDGFVEIEKCSIEDLVGLQAVVRDSLLEPGTFQLSGQAQTPALSARVTHFIDCNSGVPGVGTPEIDFNGVLPGSPVVGATCAFRGYKGGIKLTNKSGPESVSLDFVSGQAILDSTVTNGTIVVRGVCHLTDNSSGTTVVNTNGLINQELAQLAKFSTNRSVIDETAKTLTIYDDDGTTVFAVFDLKDQNGAASVTEVFERDPQ